MKARPIVPAAAIWITRTLEEAGHDTWAVGGAVRDTLLGLPTGDWDLATHADPTEVRRLFRRTVPIGIEHGTVGVLARDGTMYEVTTFRRDVETDGRHAIVAFAETIGEDLARRDFTINAIAWHPLREELLDPFDGAGDLERGVLTTVGEAEQRFKEDYLRVLRALRFAGRFGLQIDRRSWDSLRGLVDHVRALSAERVREELLKILGADPDPTSALELYGESGVLGVLYPELEALRSRPLDEPDGAGRTEWTLAVAAASHLPIGRPLLRLAALLESCSRDSVAALLVRLRLSNADVDQVARLAKAAPLPEPGADDATVRRWLSLHGKGRLSAIARLCLARARAEVSLGRDDRTEDVVMSWKRARAVRSTHPALSVADLAIDGRALIVLGLEPGPDFGRILDRLLEWVLEDPSRNDAKLLRRHALSYVEGDERD